MWAFALIRKVDGFPDLPPAAVGFVDHSLMYDDVPAIFGNWRVYCLAAKPAVLQALNDEPGIIGLCTATMGPDMDWFPEADELLDSALLDKINTWLANHDKPTIPSTWTKAQIVNRIVTYLSGIDKYHAFEWIRGRD